MTTQEIIQIIDTGNNIIMSKIFNDLIDEHMKARVGTTEDPGLEKKWQEYNGKVSILSRRAPIGTPDYKANNKLRNDYRSMIVDQGITYFIGNPVSVTLDEENSDNEKFNKVLTDFQKMNDIDDLDLETALYCSVCGYAGRVLYIDKQGKERAMNVPPWEVVFIYDVTTGELQYAMIYYKIKIVNIEKQQTKELIRVEWYDRENVYYFIQTQETPADFKGDYFMLDDSEKPNPLKHGFVGVPVVEILNNNARKGDFDRVGDLVDAYNRLTSDSQNELEDLRNAYMVFKGLVPGEEEMAKAKLTGAFGSEDPEFDVQFLTKNLSSDFYEQHKKTLNENIFKFSKRVDMNDERFSGATQSGENRKWKMLALENDAVMKERKFTKALRTMYKILCSSWNKKGITIDVLMLQFTFTRKLPIDLQYYSDIVNGLIGKVPTKILYSLLPFIPDPEGAIEMMKKENEGTIDLDKVESEDIE